jgi:hypothetical protein
MITPVDYRYKCRFAEILTEAATIYIRKLKCKMQNIYIKKVNE